MEEAVQRANEQIGSEYYELSKVNKEVWEKTGALVYGSPHGEVRNGEKRYLGNTPDGVPFTNYKFPNDSWVGGYLDDRNWVEAPWDNGLSRISDLNNKPEYEDSIKEGLKTVYGSNFKGTMTDWYKYMQILQPPTDYSPGMGRMWHVGATGTFYITVPLPPLKTGFIKLKKETSPLPTKPSRPSSVLTAYTISRVC